MLSLGARFGRFRYCDASIFFSTSCEYENEAVLYLFCSPLLQADFSEVIIESVEGLTYSQSDINLCNEICRRHWT